MIFHQIKLHQKLTQEHFIKEERICISYLNIVDKLNIMILNYLKDNHLINDNCNNLADIHKYTSTYNKSLPLNQTEGKYESPINTALENFAKSNDFLINYYDLIFDLTKTKLGCDFVFQKYPTIRCIFPHSAFKGLRNNDGDLISEHIDMMFGDPFEQINCWLALTSVFDSNAMFISTRENSQKLINEFINNTKISFIDFFGARKKFFEYLKFNKSYANRIKSTISPLSAAAGDLFLFDGRIIHGTGDNITDHTRVSVDFRLVPLNAYHEHKDLGLSFYDSKMIMGDYYHENTAHEILR